MATNKPSEHEASLLGLLISTEHGSTTLLRNDSIILPDIPPYTLNMAKDGTFRFILDRKTDMEIEL
jgi:hypothetical protein